MLCLSACDDKNDSDFTPGAPTPEGCMQVFFDKSNPSEFILQPGETTPIEVQVSRVDTLEAAEVPIVCKSADSVFEIPQTAKFAKGDSVATISISYGDLEFSHTYAFSLAIPDNYADHYTLLNGATVYQATVMQTEWKVAYENVNIYYMYNREYLPSTADIEVLKGTDRYRIQNFLGSGLDFVFTASERATTGGSYLKIEPYTNYSNDITDDYSAYYLYDTANDEWPSWEIADGITINYLSFFRTYGSDDFSYISFEDGYGQLCVSYAEYGDGSNEYYNYVLMYF